MKNWLKKARLLTLITGAVALTGCGVAETRPDLIKTSYLPGVRFSRSLLRREVRVTAYVRSAKRLTVLDPEALTETFSRTLDIEATGDVLATRLLPGGEDVLILRESAIELHAPDGKRQFDIPTWTAGYEWIAAADAAAFALVNSDDPSVTLIRALSTGKWEENNLEIPFYHDDYGDLDLAFSPDGTKLALMASDGSYALFAAPSQAEAVSEEAVTACSNTAGDSDEIDESEDSESPAWQIGAVMHDDDDRRLIAFDSNGKIAAIDVSAGSTCTVPAAWTDVVTPESLPIGVDVVADDELMIYLEGADFFTLKLAGGIVSAGAAITSPCKQVVAARPLHDDRSAVVCAVKEVDASGGESDNPDTILDYTDFNLAVFSGSDSAATVTVSMDPTRVASLALDAEADRLYLIYDNALGEVARVDLGTGDIDERQGLFTEGFIESL